MGLCEKCKNNSCGYASEDVIRCGDFEENIVQTNADRIRAMSDEELAKILNAFTAYFESCNRSEDEVDCKDCELYKLCTLFEGKAMEWLKQPADMRGEEE